MTAVVRCPSCAQLSRVPIDAVGLTVACPRCPAQFVAAPDAPPKPEPIPTVQRRQLPQLPPPPPPRPQPDLFDDDPPVVRPHAAGGAPVALAMLPLGIPLLWLILAVATRPSVFSFAAPVAIAVSVVALGLGLAGVRRWSAAVRVRALVALISLAYLAAGVLYFAQPGWLEGVRAVIPRGRQHWQEYKPDDRTFRVTLPGVPAATASPLPDWNLTAVRVADPAKPIDVFVVAHGEPPRDVPAKAADEAWFARVRQAVEAAVGATLVREQPVVVGTAQARDYEFQLPGDATAKRVVRVVRAGGRVYYLAVDGASVTFDAIDVQHFWESFRLTPGKK